MRLTYIEKKPFNGSLNVLCVYAAANMFFTYRG